MIEVATQALVCDKQRPNTVSWCSSCSLIQKNKGVEAAVFDPSLLLDQTSITILQHLLRWESHLFKACRILCMKTKIKSPTIPQRICSMLKKKKKSLHLLFSATMRCCTSQPRIYNPNTLSTSCWSWGEDRVLFWGGGASFALNELKDIQEMKLWSAYLCCFSPISSSHLISSAHRALPVKGSSQAVAQVEHICPLLLF